MVKIGKVRKGFFLYSESESEGETLKSDNSQAGEGGAMT